MSTLCKIEELTIPMGGSFDLKFDSGKLLEGRFWARVTTTVFSVLGCNDDPQLRFLHPKIGIDQIYVESEKMGDLEFKEIKELNSFIEAEITKKIHIGWGEVEGVNSSTFLLVSQK